MLREKFRKSVYMYVCMYVYRFHPPSLPILTVQHRTPIFSVLAFLTLRASRASTIIIKKKKNTALMSCHKYNQPTLRVRNISSYLFHLAGATQSHAHLKTDVEAKGVSVTPLTIPIKPPTRRT